MQLNDDDATNFRQLFTNLFVFMFFHARWRRDLFWLIHLTIQWLSILGWPSSWVEPELGRPILGLGRVEHSASARRVGPDKHFWPSGLAGFGFLSDGLDRTRIFVRSNVQFELVVWPKPESNVQLTGWAAILRFRVESGHASPSEPEPWANSRTWP
jgi:hypothetical protein